MSAHHRPPLSKTPTFWLTTDHRSPTCWLTALWYVGLLQTNVATCSSTSHALTDYCNTLLHIRLLRHNELCGSHRVFPFPVAKDIVCRSDMLVSGCVWVCSACGGHVLVPFCFAVICIVCWTLAFDAICFCDWSKLKKIKYILESGANSYLALGWPRAKLGT